MDQIWTEELGEGPLIAIALHHGHSVRNEVRPFLTLSGEDRLREEDPFTAQWTRMAPCAVVATRSRFEVDLNRSPKAAIYPSPDDTWGLGVWKQDVPDEVFSHSLAAHADFYRRIEELIGERVAEFPKVVLFDLHTYNHRRPGPHRRASPAEHNPQVDVGTFPDERDLNAEIIDCFLSRLRAFDFPGGGLDVRENVRFPIGPFAQWVHRRFPGRICALSIEVKKFFMDEWTGTADRALLDAIGLALGSVAEAVQRVLDGEPEVTEAEPAVDDAATVVVRPER